jgi:hypothetical protein
VTTSTRLEKMGKHTRKMETAKNAIGYTKLTWTQTEKKLKTKHLYQLTNQNYFNRSSGVWSRSPEPQESANSGRYERGLHKGGVINQHVDVGHDEHHHSQSTLENRL